MRSFSKTVVILGPTGSGKTGVAIEIATQASALLAPTFSSDISSSADALLSRRILNTASSATPASSNYLEDNCEVLAIESSPRMSSKNTKSSDEITLDYLEDNCGALDVEGSPCMSSKNTKFTNRFFLGRKEDSCEVCELVQRGTGLEVEIISADSRAIYKHMDIGTAKPSIEERRGIVHWGFDLVEPGERFTVADWKNYAEQKILEIKQRGNLPIVVGRTGLYIDALVYNYNFTQRAKMEQADRKEICSDYLIVGIKTEPEELRKRIVQRNDKLFTQALYDEVTKLVQKYGWGSQAMKSDIYQFAWGYLQGEYGLEKAKELANYDDWHLAKRQLTWFKRNKNINWLPLAEVKDYVIKCIQDEQRK